jgi:hypothetical protein
LVFGGGRRGATLPRTLNCYVKTNQCPEWNRYLFREVRTGEKA